MVIDNIIIKNEFLTVKLSTIGAEMQSITTPDGKEWLHQKDMIFWNGQAPVLFPICGRAFNETILVDGTKYDMKMHGFAMNSVFNLMECSDDLAVFSLISSEETKKIYPYDFELIITYKLLGNSIDISYEIINDGNGKMYFSIGSHEGYNCIEGLDNYQIIFGNKENTIPVFFEEDREYDGMNTENESIINLSNELFKNGRTLVFYHPNNDSVYLYNKETKEKIKIEYENFDNLLIWSLPYAQFVCIEPWCGMAEHNKFLSDISEKEDIQCVDAGEQFERHHIISIRAN